MLNALIGTIFAKTKGSFYIAEIETGFYLAADAGIDRSDTI